MKSELTEAGILFFICKKCNKKNYPFGRFTQRTLPHIAKVTCMFCQHRQEKKWLDQKLQTEVIKKRLRLEEYKTKTVDNISDKKIEALEAKIDSVAKEQELLRTKLDVMTKESVEEIKKDLSDHNFHLNSLQDQINRLKDTFDKIREWQDKQDKK